MADFTRAGLRPSDWWREAVRPGAEQIETITELKRLIDRLEAGESLTEDEWVSLIEGRSPELADYLFEKARCIREREYGKAVYVRGLIECSNYCKNDCLYCGIRRSNRNASRYRLSREEILSCCENGYQLGFRTFVLQGGEDPAMTDDWVMEMVQAIRAGFPDCAITLSLGEKKYDTLKRWKEAGADRYLLRHETADACHYASLHPAEMSFEHRMQCLRDLKALGYQTVVAVSTMFPWPSSVSVMTSSVLLSVREDRSFICQKISLRMTFLLSSTVATSCGSSGSVVVFTA